MTLGVMGWIVIIYKNYDASAGPIYYYLSSAWIDPNKIYGNLILSSLLIFPEHCSTYPVTMSFSVGKCTYHVGLFTISFFAEGLFS